MASTGNEYGNVPMLPVSDTSSSSRTKPFSTSRSSSIPLANTSSTIDELDHEAAQIPTPRVSATLHNPVDDDAMARRFSQFYAYTCLLSIFVDPLFFYPIEVYQKDMCIKIDWPTAWAFVGVKSVTDLLFCINFLFQCQLRFYKRGNLFVDLFMVMPLPQILLVVIIPQQLGTSWANHTKNSLSATILIQCLPKLYRLFTLIVGQSRKGFIIESALTKFFINLLTFILAGHVVGSCWYLFAFQSVNQCLRVACGKSVDECKELIDCGRVTSNQVLDVWKSNVTAQACFREDGFDYGIYWKAVKLTSNTTVWYKRYSYSLFWGFSKSARLLETKSQVTFLGRSYLLWVSSYWGFSFSLLIGNMQNFLQSLGRRDMEMTLRRRDVEQWMSHKRFPEDIRKRVKEVERFNWSVTRGVDEESLFKNMPEDLQRDIRRHIFAFLKKDIFEDG